MILAQRLYNLVNWDQIRLGEFLPEKRPPLRQSFPSSAQGTCGSCAASACRARAAGGLEPWMFRAAAACQAHAAKVILPPWAAGGLEPWTFRAAAA